MTENVKTFKEETRADSALDSITVGSASRMQLKLYFDSTKDNEETLLPKIDMAISLMKYAKQKMGDDYETKK